MSKKSPKFKFLLDQGFTKDIGKWKLYQDRVLKYHWDFYTDLAYQRAKIADELKGALLEATRKQYKFPKWQRTVRLKYSTDPLSIVGSLKDQAGGRFNIGDIDPSKFCPFPALYVAMDRKTSLQEVLCQNMEKSHSDLSPLDFALADPSSIAHISVSGYLYTIIDLNQPKKLQSFVDLIKNFTLSKHLANQARMLKLPEPTLINTTSLLVDSLLSPEWRHWPMQYDVPVASQIFGQLVLSCGIDGILYQSKFSGKNCLAIYPQNFDEFEGAYVELDDAAAPGTKVTRWDHQTWREHN